MDCLDEGTTVTGTIQWPGGKADGDLSEGDLKKRQCDWCCR